MRSLFGTTRRYLLLNAFMLKRGLRPFRRVGNSLLHFQKSKILLVTSQLALSWLCSYTKLRGGLPLRIPYNLFLLYVTATQLAISVFLGSLSPQSDYLPLEIPLVSSIRYTRVGSHDPPRISKLSRRVPRHPSKTVMVLFVTIMQAIAAHIMPISHNLADTPTLYILGSLVLLFTPVLERGLAFQSSHQLASLLLMFCGVLLSQPPDLPPNTIPNYAFLFLLVAFSSLLSVARQEFYRWGGDDDLHAQNIYLTSVQVVVYAVASCKELYNFNFDSFHAPLRDGIILTAIALHALIGLSTFGVLKRGGAVMAAVLTVFNGGVVIVASMHSAPSWDFRSIIGIVALFWGAYTFQSSPLPPKEILVRGGSGLSAGQFSGKSSDQVVQRFWLLMALLASGLSLSFAIILPRTTPQLPRYPRSQFLAAPLIASFPTDIFLIPPSERVSRQCERRVLASHDYHTRYTTNESFHQIVNGAFDDILLIVFFSHARYDVNLDLYREAYSPYFPNMVFVGPASREDAGFNHSYDVILDSYQSDEDLSDPKWFKMAGRMAHHMLYTVLKKFVTSHDCYQGYLWAPFDTFLNVPRLSHFSPEKIWYHSPFGENVANPALKNSSMHPPPARISPDPYGNVTEIWRGWAPDWWWGESHVGLSVCMPAFHKVPIGKRQRLALLTGNQTKLIGGSSDTVYIPDRLLPDFLEVLSLFLETNCFLEIALPTTLHLILPPNETISYVDHWWIWKPPFNVSFVREKWVQGFEVDSFHTFHWGEMQNGNFTAKEGIVDDVQTTLWESFQRQQGVLNMNSTGQLGEQPDYVGMNREEMQR